ncbi:hypothetical protein DFH09DRAFT_1275779 [Mycena vulgaris]|nr:hypothetical protein DFH09DRAFT_1275779 [Mycena vulgaris]
MSPTPPPGPCRRHRKPRAAPIHRRARALRDPPSARSRPRSRLRPCRILPRPRHLSAMQFALRPYERAPHFPRGHTVRPAEEWRTKTIRTKKACSSLHVQPYVRCSFCRAAGPESLQAPGAEGEEDTSEHVNVASSGCFGQVGLIWIARGATWTQRGLNILGLHSSMNVLGTATSDPRGYSQYEKDEVLRRETGQQEVGSAGRHGERWQLARRAEVGTSGADTRKTSDGISAKTCSKYSERANRGSAGGRKFGILGPKPRFRADKIGARRGKCLVRWRTEYLLLGGYIPTHLYIHQTLMKFVLLWTLVRIPPFSFFFGPPSSASCSPNPPSFYHKVPLGVPKEKYRRLRARPGSTPAATPFVPLCKALPRVSQAFVRQRGRPGDPVPQRRDHRITVGLEEASSAEKIALQRRCRGRLVELRRRHQTIQAARGVRIQILDSSKSDRAQAESLRQQLTRKLHLALKEEQDLAVGTGLERGARWRAPAPGGRGGNVPGLKSALANSNSANAALTATAVAKLAATKRKAAFIKAKVPHLAEVVEARVSILRPIRLGDYGVILTASGLMVGHVFGMNAKGGGKYGKHEPVTNSSTIAALSKSLCKSSNPSMARSSGPFRRPLLSPKVVLTGLELCPDDAARFKILTKGTNGFQEAMKLFRKTGKRGGAAGIASDDYTDEEKQWQMDARSGADKIWPIWAKILADKNRPIGRIRDLASKGNFGGPVNYW